VSGTIGQILPQLFRKRDGMTKAPKLLVLAGRRNATLDPLAEKFGVSHKCLVPVRGEAMIARVLNIVDAAFPGEPIFVSIEDFSILDGEPTAARLVREGRLKPVPAQEHIVDSVVSASAVTGFPLLITTADNVLMTPQSLRRMAEEGRPPVDALIAMARKGDIRATHPQGQNRFYEFKDDGFSNCNMFWIGSERALRATEAFREGGQFAKKPERIVKAFGILNLLRFRLGRHTLAQMLGFISGRFGVEVRAVVFDGEGRLAIDVDNERTHGVAEEVLARA
jgi:GTP:adenosylcobinamide-phosphate guanylyltransferase